MSFFCVSSLTKRLGTNKILQNIRFEIGEGEFITVLGPPECGKSALLRTLAGQMQPDAGNISVAGREVGQLSPRERNIALLSPADTLFSKMTVAENIASGLKMKRIPRPEIACKVRRILQLLDLEDKAQNYPRHLSDGQQQKALLARALAVEPQILLWDEAQDGGDAQAGKSLRLHIRALQKSLKLTIVWATRDQEAALTVSDRIFLMERGRFTQSGTPEEIYTKPDSEFAARFIGNYNILRRGELSAFAASQLKGDLFAVRPESIEMVVDLAGARPDHLWEKRPEIIPAAGPRPDAIRMEGLVIDMVMLGQILRNFIRVERRILMVDLVSRGACPTKPGQSVTLFVPYDECLSLNTSHPPLKLPA